MESRLIADTFSSCVQLKASRVVFVICILKIALLFMVTGYQGLPITGVLKY